jgi:hypothetical protein
MTYPPELEAVLMKAVAKDPDKRYSSALEFARALEQTLPDSERAHGGEYVGTFIKGLLGAQHDQQRAALTEALRRADRNSMAPPASALEGLTGSGTSSVSSLSGVAGSRTSNDILSAPDFHMPTPWERARVPLGIAALALVAGGGAFFWTRSARKPPAPAVVAAPHAPTMTEPAAPRVDLNSLPVEPTPSATATSETAPVESASTPTLHVGKGAARPQPAPAPPAPPAPKKKGAWRQDPGF